MQKGFSSILKWNDPRMAAKNEIFTTAIEEHQVDHHRYSLLSQLILQDPEGKVLNVPGLLQREKP
jgi:hypothetical protein